MRLIDYRKLRGLSRAQAAKDLAVDKTTYWRWEKGERFPAVAAIQRIAKWSAGAVTADDLMPPAVEVAA